MTRATSSGILRPILQRTKTAVAAGETPLAVFDLDSTLYDVSPRIQQILWEFSQLPEIQTRFPETAQVLQGLKVIQSDWGIRATLLRAGLDAAHPEVHKLAKEFWIERFFSNAYLVHDVVYPGAVEFVQELARLGAKITYLTGRDQLRMGQGTIDCLQKHGFPLNGGDATLQLKPLAGMDDAQFKVDYFKTVTGQHKPIWFFENEPVNIRLLQTHEPAVEVIFFQSTHSGKAEPPAELPQILHYLLEED